MMARIRSRDDNPLARRGMGVVLLALGVIVFTVLWLSNPTLSGYLTYLEGHLVAALSHMDPAIQGQERHTIESAVATKGRRLMLSLVRDHTRRYTGGIASLYVTDVADIHMVTVGFAGAFVPIRGLDQGILTLGRLIFQGRVASPAIHSA
jgi:hypothetical protein